MGDDADDTAFGAKVFDRAGDDFEGVVVECAEAFIEKEGLESRRAVGGELGGLFRERQRQRQ